MGIVYAIISWLVFGLIIGALAQFLVPGRQNLSLPVSIAVGVVGSFIGGAIAYLFTGSGVGFFQPAGWILSIIGAVIVLLIYIRLMASKKV